MIENPREIYLLLLVHGIGTQEEWQLQHIKDFNHCLVKVQELYFKNSPYEFVIKMVNWKSLLNNEETKAKVDRVTIKEGSQSARELFNETVVDILFYLSKGYRSKILQRIADEANNHYKFLSKNPRFNGKVSFVGHSLGTVILYDILLRQNPEH